MESGKQITIKLESSDPSRPVEIKELRTGGKGLATTHISDSTFGKFTSVTMSADAPQEEILKALKMLKLRKQKNKKSSTAQVHQKLESESIPPTPVVTKPRETPEAHPTSISKTETVGPTVISGETLESLNILSIGDKNWITKSEITAPQPLENKERPASTEEKPIPDPIEKEKQRKDGFLKALEVRHKKNLTENTKSTVQQSTVRNFPG